MRIAIPSDSDKVCEHFGRAPEFTIIETEKNRIKSKKIIPNPGHMTGYLPKYLSEQKIDTVIAGGAGPRAVELFKEYKIRFIQGVTGPVDEAVGKFLEGTLDEGSSTCTPSTGKGFGIKKEDGHE